MTLMPRSTRLAMFRATDCDRGAVSAEYALLASLIAAVVVVGVSAFGLSVQGLFLAAAGI